MSETDQQSFNKSSTLQFESKPDLLEKIKNSKVDLLSNPEEASLFLQNIISKAAESILNGNDLCYKDEIDLINRFQLIKKFPREVLQYKNKVVLYLIYTARFQECLSVAETGFEEAVSTENFDLAFLFLNNEGSCYWRTGNNNLALNKFLHAIEISKKVEINDNHFKPNCNAGLIFQSFGLMLQSYEYFMKALEIAEQTNDDYAKAAVYGNLGVFYFDMGDVEKSKEYYLKSINIWEGLKNHKGLSEIYNNISIYHCERGEFEVAREYIMKSINLSKSLNQVAQYINALESLSTIEIKSGNLENGEELVMEALKLSQENNIPFVEKQCYDTLASMYITKKDKALDYAVKSLSISRKMKDQRLIKASLNSLSTIYEEHGDFVNAYKYHKEMFEINEKIKNEEYSNKIAGLESNYEFKEVKKESEYLKRRNEELSHLIIRLEKLNSEKSEFLGIAAHDLRNPLNSIIGFSDFLLNYLSPTDEAYSRIKDIKISADSMLELITNLLDIDKIEAGSIGLDISKFPLAGFINNIISRFSLHAKLKNQKLIFSPSENEIEIETDKNSLNQIIENLISNAIKFSPTSGTINIKISEVNEKIKLDIIDNGPGFSKSEKEKIFKKFPKISNKPTSDESSTGLGLFIVKKLTDSIKGEITFEDNNDKGITFTLILPKKVH